MVGGLHRSAPVATGTVLCSERQRAGNEKDCAPDPLNCGVHVSPHFFKSPKQYRVESWSTAKTLPSDTARPLKWTHVAIASPLLYSSFPVLASSAFSTAACVFLNRLASPPRCTAFSPVERPNTTPLAITTGSGRLKS